MGQLLIDVLTLEKEGLVGFIAETGEQVPLSAPKPIVLIGATVGEILQEHPENTYIQLGQFGDATPYNLYTRRKKE